MAEDDPKVAPTLPLGRVGHGVASPSPVPPTEPPDAPPHPGHATSDSELRRLGRFEVKAKLGEGGMGVVLLATDPQLGRRVALKVLRRELDSPDARRRLLREAQGVAQLTHENVIVVHEVGNHDGHDYVAMEYVAGGTLSGWQVGKAWQEIVAMYCRAGRGLAAAHEAGLVHRDFKPDNVLVGSDGRVRVSDFGLVAAVGEAHELSEAQRELRDGSELAVSLTRTGSIMGTPRYMAPEQHLGQDADPRADQFAFCAALFEALYGRPPFAAESYPALVAMALAGELGEVPADSPVPPAIRDAILRGLSRRREDRFPSMRELLAALEPEPPSRTLASPPPPRRSPWILPGVFASIALVAVGAVVVARGGSDDTEPPPADAGPLRVIRTVADLKQEGSSELQAGNFAKAAEWLERARALDPAADVDGMLATAYLKANNCAGARAAFDRDIARQDPKTRAELELSAARQMEGCRKPSRVTVTDTTITALDRIAFDDADNLTTASKEPLDVIGHTLRSHLELRRVEVHVRVARGARSTRQARADRRVQVLRETLLARGVDRARLHVSGEVMDEGEDAVVVLLASRIVFQFDPDDQPSPAMRAELDEVVRLVRRDPATYTYEVEVTMIETAANFREVGKLAERRAMAVRDHLIGAGIAPKRVTAKSSVSARADADKISIVRRWK